MLIFALWWLNKQNKVAAKEVKLAFDAAHAERTARFNLLESQVTGLNVRVTSCEADRQSLWGQIVKLAGNQTPPASPTKQI